MVPTLQPKVLGRWVALLLFILISTRKDLLKFTCSPIESEKGLRKPFKLKSTLASCGSMSRASSAYCTIGKSPWKFSPMGCLRTPFYQALLTILWKRSVARTNKRENKGSPCLTPLKQLKGFPGIPLSSTEEDPLPRMFLIHFNHFSEKPLCLRICKMA